MAGTKKVAKKSTSSRIAKKDLSNIDISASTEHLKDVVLEEILKGTTITDIAKMCNKTRQTIYNWLDDSNMKKKIDEFRQQNLAQVTNAVSLKSSMYMNELEKLAMTTKDERIKANILTYLLDHAIGKATTKIETKDTTDNKQVLDNVDLDAMLNNYNNKAQDVEYKEE